jgi:Kef-type K+ transport system membrane component KefB
VNVVGAGSAGGIAGLMAALVVIIVAALAVGRLFRSLQQPPVIGEMLAGILLGPSVLGRAAPDLVSAVFPAGVTAQLRVLADLGIVLYMFVVGVRLDTRKLGREAGRTFNIAQASIVVPFIAGVALSIWFYPSMAGPGVGRGVFAMFMGLALSVTAFPVLARILHDRGLDETPLGQRAMACAAFGDVIAWCLLALTVAMAQARAAAALPTIGLTAAYVALMLVVVRPVVRRACRRLDESKRVPVGVIVLAVSGALASALLTELIGVHALFGAFLLGALVPRDSLLGTELLRRLEDVVVVVLLPGFFALVGLRTQIGLVHGVEMWVLCGVVILAAFAAKIGGTAVVARLAGLGGRDAASLGVLMNARGLMELIVLNLGLELGIITPALFAVLVLMTLVTTFATSPLLHVLTRRPSREAETFPGGAAATERP